MNENSVEDLSFAGWLCPECTYDLRGLREAVCPECGHQFDSSEMVERVGFLEAIGWAVALSAGALSVPLAIHAGLEQVETMFSWGCCRAQVSTGEPCVIFIALAWSGFAAAYPNSKTRRLARLGALVSTAAWFTMFVVLGVT